MWMNAFFITKRFMRNLISSTCHTRHYRCLALVALGCRLTWDWSKWMMTFRSAGRSFGPPLTAGPAEGSSCGEKHACSHSVQVIIWNFCIRSSLMRIILLRKSLTSWSLMPSSSCSPRGGGVKVAMVHPWEGDSNNSSILKLVFRNVQLALPKTKKNMDLHGIYTKV